VVGFALLVLVVPLVLASFVGIRASERFTSPAARAAVGIGVGLVTLALIVTTSLLVVSSLDR
jgi:hypothetical protein